MSYCFGIDIGGTTVKCGLFTTEGVLLEKWEIKPVQKKMESNPSGCSRNDPEKNGRKRN